MTSTQVSPLRHCRVLPTGRTDASDLGMEKDIVLRDLLGQLHRHPGLDTLIFTGGNTRNGREDLFRRHCVPWPYDLSGRMPIFTPFDFCVEQYRQVFLG